MDELVSILSVIGFWIALSTSMWWVHRHRMNGKLNRQIALARQALSQTLAAQAVFDKVRGAAFPDGVIGGNDELQRETFALLRRIQASQPYFNDMTVVCAQIRRAVKCDECPPLSELMHIRRDLWAASEIVLMEDLRALCGTRLSAGEGGEEGEDETTTPEQLRAAAAAVMFKSLAEDPIDLRLAIAREEAERFVADVDEAARRTREADRLPTPGEIMAYPLSALRATPRYARAFAAYVARIARYVRALARRLRESETLARGVHELRRAREVLPGRVATGAGKASAAAHQGAVLLHRHYKFLVAAHDLQAKYEQLLSRRGEIPERGREFLARLEAAARSERLRLNWTSAVDWLKRRLVCGLAHLIAGLERLKERFEEVNAEIMRKAVALAAVRRLALPAPVPGREVVAPVVFLNPVTREVATTLMARLASARKAEQTAKVVTSPESVATQPEEAAADGNAPARACAAADALADDNPTEDDPPVDDADSDAEEPGPLTRSVMEVQAKLAAKPQFPGFPWVRR